MLLQYNLQKMHKLLESFYILTKIRIVMLDTNFVKIAEYPSCDCAFCTLIRQNETALAQCIQSDRHACEQCRATNSLYTYTCHAGLEETVTPIHHGSLVIGYLMIG